MSLCVFSGVNDVVCGVFAVIFDVFVFACVAFCFVFGCVLIVGRCLISGILLVFVWLSCVVRGALCVVCNLMCCALCLV